MNLFDSEPHKKMAIFTTSLFSITLCEISVTSAVDPMDHHINCFLFQSVPNGLNHQNQFAVSCGSPVCKPCWF